MQMEKVEAYQMEEEKKAAEAKCKDAEQEKDQLKKALEELRTTSKAYKKELEKVWVGFTAKKK